MPFELFPLVVFVVADFPLLVAAGLEERGFVALLDACDVLCVVLLCAVLLVVDLPVSALKLCLTLPSAGTLHAPAVNVAAISPHTLFFASKLRIMGPLK